MGLTLLAILGIVVMGIVGYFRGALMMLASLLALLGAGLLAIPLQGIGAGLSRIGGMVPLSLQPLAGPLITGILFFVILMIPLEILLSKRRKRRVAEGQTARSSWEGPVGAGLGMVWGFFLACLILTGITLISKVQTAMREANAEVAYRQERRHKEEVRVNRIARITHQKPQPISLNFELEAVDRSQLKLEPPSPLEDWAASINNSPFSIVVTKVNPVDDRAQKLLRDLTVVVGDAVLFDRFQNHPKVVPLMHDPTLVLLSQDPEIAKDVRDGEYRKLLDNPKLADVAKNKELGAKMKELDLANVLRDVKSQTVEVQRGL